VDRRRWKAGKLIEEFETPHAVFYNKQGGTDEGSLNALRWTKGSYATDDLDEEIKAS
jgi:hypothetical protein